MRSRAATRIQLGREARQHRCSSSVVHLGQQHQAARALYQHAHRGLVAGAFDEVALPVAPHRAIFHLGRAHVDADPIGELPAPVFTPRARQPSARALAHTDHQRLAQFSPRLNVDGRADGRVDGLVRNVAIGVVGEHTLVGSGNLLRRPLPVEHRAHHAPAHAAEGQLGGRSGGHAPAEAGDLRGADSAS